MITGNFYSNENGMVKYGYYSFQVQYRFSFWMKYELPKTNQVFSKIKMKLTRKPEEQNVKTLKISMIVF